MTDEPKKPRARRGRKEGAIYQRKDGRYRGAFEMGYAADGTRLRHVEYGATKKEVIAKLDKARADHRSGTLPPSTHPAGPG